MNFICLLYFFAGNSVCNMGYSVILSGDTFLGSQDYGGFLYFRHSYQCLEGLDLPENQPFLFAVLLSKWEMPWAKVFPLRLLLRCGHWPVITIFCLPFVKKIIESPGGQTV